MSHSILHRYILKNTAPAILAILILSSCIGRPTPPAQQTGEEMLETGDIIAPDVTAIHEPEEHTPPLPLSRTARLLDSLGYVNISDLDPSIGVEMIYSTADNFTGEVLYEDLNEAYLLPDAAAKLVRAQSLLKELHPDYSLLVYDAARPMSAQRKMWAIAVKGGKQYYVANPAKGGGLHNYGAAVDLTITDGNGHPLSMGTLFDHLGPQSNIDREAELVSQGTITPDDLANRLLLRKVMTGAGFTTVQSEWWHFNHCSRAYAVGNYPLIDF